MALIQANQLEATNCWHGSWKDGTWASKSAPKDESSRTAETRAAAVDSSALQDACYASPAVFRASAQSPASLDDHTAAIYITTGISHNPARMVDDFSGIHVTYSDIAENVSPNDRLQSIKYIGCARQERISPLVLTDALQRYGGIEKAMLTASDVQAALMTAIALQNENLFLSDSNRANAVHRTGSVEQLYAYSRAMFSRMVHAVHKAEGNSRTVSAANYRIRAFSEGNGKAKERTVAWLGANAGLLQELAVARDTALLQVRFPVKNAVTLDATDDLKAQTGATSAVLEPVAAIAIPGSVIATLSNVRENMRLVETALAFSHRFADAKEKNEPDTVESVLQTLLAQHTALAKAGEEQVGGALVRNSHDAMAAAGDNMIVTTGVTAGLYEVVVPGTWSTYCYVTAGAQEESVIPFEWQVAASRYAGTLHDVLAALDRGNSHFSAFPHCTERLDMTGRGAARTRREATLSEQVTLRENRLVLHLTPTTVREVLNAVDFCLILDRMQPAEGSSAARRIFKVLSDARIFTLS